MKEIGYVVSDGTVNSTTFAIFVWNKEDLPSAIRKIARETCWDEVTVNPILEPIDHRVDLYGKE